MPNNCSALIQRKQQILHKILRSNSESKLQNAVTETTNELRVAGTRKSPAHSSSPNHLTTGPTGASTIRRSTLFTTHRTQPSTDHFYQTHLPSIRDASGSVERDTQPYDDVYTRTRPKTPATNTSPKSTTRTPSASMSSLHNVLAKRSTENLMSSNGELDELLLPPSRHSRRPSNESNKYLANANQTSAKLTLIPRTYSGDSGVDTRYLISSPDTNQHQRITPISGGTRSSFHNGRDETPTKERTIQHYQRRTNNTVRAPIKQRIEKYRRRSEETSNGNTLLATANAGLSATSPALTTPSSARPKPPPPTPMPVRRVTSDAEIRSRLEVLRLSMNTSLAYTDQQYSQTPRTKSPHLYSTHQQLARPVTPQTPSVILRRRQQISSATPSQQRHNSSLSHRRQQQVSAAKQSTDTGQGNLYLAFIASRHLSSLEHTLFESDVDHPKLLRIFNWLQNVEKHRPQQANHDQLIIEQNQRMLDQEENYSLYSEVKYAVDDLPANTSGKPCEKIATMTFED